MRGNLPHEFNPPNGANYPNSHHLEQNPNLLFPSGIPRKPSLLSGYSGYHSPENMGPMPMSGSQRYYVPPNVQNLSNSGSMNSQSAQQNNSQSSFNAAIAASAFMNNLTNSNQRLPPPNNDEKPRHNQMSIITNQPALRNNSLPFNQQSAHLHSPNHSNLPFTQAAFAAALSSMGITPNHPNYSQIIQQPFQLQQQSIQQLHQQQLKHFQPDIKKEPIPPPPIQLNQNSNPHAQILKPSITHQQMSSNTNSSSSMSTSSSSYVPQVEAISPTPEDQKENSNLQALKEKICTEICKVEKDIASTQYQLEQSKKKQVALI